MGLKEIIQNSRQRHKSRSITKIPAFWGECVNRSPHPFEGRGRLYSSIIEENAGLREFLSEIQQLNIRPSIYSIPADQERE